MSTELISKAIFFALFFALLAIRILFAWKARQADQNSCSLPKEAVKREGNWGIIHGLAMGLCFLVLVVVYAVLMLCFVGLSLVTAAWPFLLLAVVTIPFFYRVSRKEEEMMIEQLGDEYGEYKKRAGRFLPQLFANRHSTQREWHLSERR